MINLKSKLKYLLTLSIFLFLLFTHSAHAELVRVRVVDQNGNPLVADWFVDAWNDAYDFSGSDSGHDFYGAADMGYRLGGYPVSGYINPPVASPYNGDYVYLEPGGWLELTLTYTKTPINCAGSWGSCSNGSQTYNVTTSASGGGSSCPYSNGATQPCTPTIPTGLWAGPSSCGNNWINVSWNSSGGATSYQLYRDGALIYNGAGLSTSDTGLVLGSTHSYTITASNSGGTSPTSAAVSATTASACNFTLTVNTAGAGSGTVSGAGSYVSGTQATAGAVPSSGSSFAGWAVDCNSSGQVVMNANKICTAVFNSIPSASAPTISGPTSGYPSTSYTHSFMATDPSGYQVRYGVDWNMDSVADEWLPAGSSYVNSGVSQSTSHSWSSVGAQSFKALSQNSAGVNSSWTNYSITIDNVPVAGVCGTANKTYDSTATSYGADTYCSTGSPSSSPSFPAAGASVTWSCNGVYGGSSSPICTASRLNTMQTVYVVPGAGGFINSTDAQINCTSRSGCSYSYSNGSTVILRAIPNSSYWVFTGWSGDCSGASSVCMLNVNSNKSVSASFVLRAFRYQEF